MEITTPDYPLVQVHPAEFGLPEAEAEHVASAFVPLLEQMTDLEPTFQEIAATEEITPELSAEARKLRLQYVRIRTATASVHKDRKAYYLAGGRYVDAWKNAQGRVSEDRESRLAAIEDHFERIERERIAAIESERYANLLGYGMQQPVPGLGTMSDEAFAALEAGAKLQYEQRIAAERKAEADRIAAEQAEREERARIAAENERLRAEAAERQREIDRERKEAAAKQAEADRALRAAQQEAERQRAEAARQEREVARMKAEEEARQRADAERARAQQEAAEKAARVAPAPAGPLFDDRQQGRLDVIEWMELHGHTNAATRARAAFSL